MGFAGKKVIKPRDQFPARTADDAKPLRVMRAARGGGGANVVSAGFLVCEQGSIIFCRRPQGFLAAGGNGQQQIFAATSGFCGVHFARRRRGGFENDVNIGAAETECVDSGQLRAGNFRKVFELLDDAQLELLKINVGIGIFEMQAGRNDLVLEDERDLDEAGDAGAGFEVADVGFNRANQTGILPAFTQRGPKRVGFNRIADGRAGAVRLDIADLRR